MHCVWRLQTYQVDGSEGLDEAVGATEAEIVDDADKELVAAAETDEIESISDEYENAVSDLAATDDETQETASKANEQVEETAADTEVKTLEADEMVR